MADVVVAVENDRARLLDHDEIADEVNGSDGNHREGSEDDASGQRNNNGNREEKKDDDIVILKNVHKTYLLGIEGVAALR
jgi:hypothetical protein